MRLAEFDGKFNQTKHSLSLTGLIAKRRENCSQVDSHYFSDMLRTFTRPNS